MQIPPILDDENAYQYTARNGLENTKLKLSQLSILRWITPQIIDFQNAVKDYGILNKLACSLDEAKELLKTAVDEGKVDIGVGSELISIEHIAIAIERIELALAQTNLG